VKMEMWCLRGLKPRPQRGQRLGLRHFSGVVAGRTKRPWGSAGYTRGIEMNVGCDDVLLALHLIEDDGSHIDLFPLRGPRRLTAYQSGQFGSTTSP
jgi:hypothetical protein